MTGLPVIKTLLVAGCLQLQSSPSSADPLEFDGFAINRKLFRPMARSILARVASLPGQTPLIPSTVMTVPVGLRLLAGTELIRGLEKCEAMVAEDGALDRTDVISVPGVGMITRN